MYMSLDSVKRIVILLDKDKGAKISFLGKDSKLIYSLDNVVATGELDRQYITATKGLYFAPGTFSMEFSGEINKIQGSL